MSGRKSSQTRSNAWDECEGAQIRSITAPSPTDPLGDARRQRNIRVQAGTRSVLSFCNYLDQI